ncbi:MAG: hypothetical protein IT378_14375 [Sandaracinaceae bacterium]|nr:hypothetical protein [Sandaracinaceae bacterium]
MPRYTEMTGRSKLVVLEPRVTRAFWSKRRAWQGETLTLHVETKHVPDGASMTIEIWEDGTDEGRGNERIAEVSGSHTIDKGRYQVDYELRLDPDTLGQELELEGDAWELYFVVRFESPAASGRSGLLYVDLQSLVVSV